jgi:glycosyltransferase involved in cell wall biosynthesis
MAQVKVLRIITRMNVGGPALHVLLLSDGLARRGYETLLAAGTCDEAEGDLPLSIPPEQIVLAVENLARSISPGLDLKAAWKLYGLIRRERPAIVHTHTAKAGLVGRIAAAAAGVPVVIHTFHGNSLTGYFSPRVSAVMRAVEKFLARFTDCICVVSAQQQEEIAGRFHIAPRAKIRVIPLGLDLSEELRQPLPDASGRKLRVGWLGRMVPIKGVPLLAGVIDEAARRELPVQFLVGGDGPERAWLENAARRHAPDRLLWNGWEQNPCRFIAGCDVLLQTSINEGTPVALIQGMAAGRPFLSTPAGGVVDLASSPMPRRDDSCRWFGNCVLAEPSPTSFANALGRLSGDAARVREMGANARRFAAARFQAGRLVDEMDLLYRELIAEHLQASAPYTSLQKLTGDLG